MNFLDACRAIFVNYKEKRCGTRYAELKFAHFFITLYGKSKKVCLRPKNGAVSVSKHFWALIRANTVQLPGADLDPPAEVGFWWGCFGLNCFHLALREAESDFGLQDYETDLSNL